LLDKAPGRRRLLQPDKLHEKPMLSEPGQEDGAVSITHTGLIWRPVPTREPYQASASITEACCAVAQVRLQAMFDSPGAIGAAQASVLALSFHVQHSDQAFL